MSTTAAETWDAIYRSGAPVRYWPNEDVIRFCFRRLAPGLARVLEVGCGNGANTWGLLESNCEVVATDVSRTAIDMAQRYVGGRFAVMHRATFYELSLGGLSSLHHVEPPFDAIVDCRVSQHVAWGAHLTAYRNYFELLKPGGWLFLLHLDRLTSDARRNDDLRHPSEQWTWENIEDGVYPHNGLVCMPPTIELSGVVFDAGLVVKRIEVVERLLPDVGLLSSHTAIDAQRPA